MQYRIDPKTGNKLSALGFGCMRFPKSFEKTEEMILHAIKQGVNYFDTAYLYSGSEETLGKILSKNNVRDQVYLATKLPNMLCRSGSDFDKYFDRQLERLKTDHIDYYLIHMLGDINRWDTLCRWGIKEWIQTKKESGQIKQIGFSFHGAQNQFMRLLDAYDWEFCLIQYNYSDKNYQAGVTGLKRASEKGLPVFVMEPLLGGELANGLPQEAVNIFKRSNSKLSPAAWALKWVWDQPEVTLLLSGMNEPEQLRENIAIAEKTYPNSLTEKEHKTFERVIEIFNASYKIHCTSCNYCMPCPHHVNIPACFSAYNTSFTMGKKAGMKNYLMSAGGMSRQKNFASLCKKCGKCELRCPQRIEIIKSLELVSKRMEPLWLRPALSVARVFMGLKKE